MLTGTEVLTAAYLQLRVRKSGNQNVHQKENTSLSGQNAVQPIKEVDEHGKCTSNYR
jgi:hypothetical protein